jgi:hypothetical protein
MHSYFGDTTLAAHDFVRRADFGSAISSPGLDVQRIISSPAIAKWIEKARRLQ